MKRLITEMNTCVQDLGGCASYANIEKWACTVYKSMSSSSRSFHSVQHAFDIIPEDSDSIQKLAAYFHDVVYYTIDGCLNEDQQSMIGDCICEDDGVVSIAENSSDENFLMTMDIFGYGFGKILDPFKGLNEFLSAAIAVRCYQVSFSSNPAVLAQISACIEATIPFRKHDENGKDVCESLFDRMTLVNKKYNLGLTEEELVKSVQRAVELRNSDLGNFAAADHAVFLSNTWNLLPESNVRLRNKKFFRISDFAFALKKMTSFIEFLDPESLYGYFRDPEYEILMAEMTKAARLNIDVALDYMHCKRVSISVVAAIAELTGGDAPIALFLGENYIAQRIVELIKVGAHPDLKHNKSVLNILSDGRDSDSNFDIRSSPFAAYIYALVGTDGVDQCMKYAVHPMDKENALALLRALPYDCVFNIVASCAENCITRIIAMGEMMEIISN